MLLSVFMLVALRPTTAYSVRFGLFVPGVLLLVLGASSTRALPSTTRFNTRGDHVEQLIDMRLQQLWDVSCRRRTEQTLATHTGATWGMLEGERLQLKLDIEEAIPTDDGRWQLLVPELTSPAGPSHLRTGG